MTTQLWQMGAAELAAVVREGRASAREVIAAHIERIDAVNPQLNAVTVLLGEQALDAADVADRALAAKQTVGPLHGVPMTVKENIDLVGSATTEGIVAFRDVMPRADAPHIAELKSAGAIPIARTNMPDFGLRWHTDNALRGPTLNPWDSGRTPGGSSGGDASALAAGMTPLGMGNDLAGSLRWPSQCCGTVALKPGLGRVAMANMRGGVAPAIGSQLLAVHGPMARSVPDLRLAFGAMCGRSPSDPWHVPLPLGGPPVGRPIRVSVVADPSGRGVDPDIANAVARAADALADAGYAVEEGEPPSLQRAAEVYFQILAIPRNEGVANPMDDLASKDYIRFTRAVEGAFEAAGGEPAPDAFGERHALARAWGEFQEQRPLILAPVATVPACPVGFDLREGDDAVAWIRALRMIVVVNLLGLPSVALPTGEANGLPHGVQIIGPRYREDLCLDAAEAVEERLGAITPIDPR